MNFPPQLDVVEELSKLTLGNKIDFTVKSSLTDVTFIIEGKKIYAGRDFLSIYSPVFKTLLREGSSAENDNGEIMLEDVTYKDFLEMLECLVDPSRKMKAEVVESLLILGDRFEIKYLMDRVESFVMDSKEFYVASKLLLADRYRLMKLQTLCIDFTGKKDEPKNGGQKTNCAEGCAHCSGMLIDLQNVREVVISEQFRDLSPAAKKALCAIKDKKPIGWFRPESFVILQAVENVEAPPNGFVASGTIDANYPMIAHRIDLAGVCWMIHYYGLMGDPDLDMVYLSVNRDRPSSQEWSVEGFVEVRTMKMNSGTGREEWRREKEYAFSFNNTNRVGQLRYVEKNDKFSRNQEELVLQITIHITSISGMRKDQSFDFTSLSDLSNAVFVAEGRKIHVNKQFVSTISPRFKEMFSNKTEVELQNVQYEEFIEFLHWIYPSSRRTLSVTSLFNVMRTGQKLGVNIDISMYQDFLRQSFRGTNTLELIFLFQFNYGIQGSVRLGVDRPGYMFSDDDCKRIKACDLLAKMTPEKKEALLKYVNDNNCNNLMMKYR